MLARREDEHLDELVRGIVLDHLDCKQLDAQQPEVRDHWIRTIIKQVTLAENKLSIDLDADQIEVVQTHDFVSGTEPSPSRPTCIRKPEIEDRGRFVRLTLRVQIKKLDGRRLLLSPEGNDLAIPSKPEPKQHLVDAIGLAYRWHDELAKTGEPIATFARRISVGESRIHKLLPLTYLGPATLDSVFRGTLPPRITLGDLLDAARHLDWSTQQRHLGIRPAA